MDRISEISEATLGLLLKNYILILSLLGLVLAFALYVYFVRNPLSEFFEGTPAKKETEKKESAQEPVPSGKVTA